MEDLINETIKWADSRGIFQGSDPKTQCLKFLSEAGEVADDIAKGRHGPAQVEIGDVIVTLILLCEMIGTTPEHCLHEALTKITKRNGSMINGVFVKEGSDMSGENWTKGPWWIEAETGDVVARDGDWEICTFSRSDDSHEADTYLIAAAPDLYEALDLLVKYVATPKSQRGELSREEGEWLLANAEQALAKARGGDHG